jgi:hypothetical protein
MKAGFGKYKYFLHQRNSMDGASSAACFNYDARQVEELLISIG